MIGVFPWKGLKREREVRMKKEKNILDVETQVGFPLYAATKEVFRACQVELTRLGLTYTQYLAMSVIWELKRVNLKAIGERIFLDSGTLTPLLKKLELKGYIVRERLKDDERSMVITLTTKGKALRKKVRHIPEFIESKLGLSSEETEQLQGLLFKVLHNVKGDNM